MMLSALFSVGDKMGKSKKGKQRIYRIISIISVLGFVACSLVLLYPVISDRWNRYRDDQLVTNYNKTVREADTSKIDAIREEAMKYNKYLRLQNRSIVTDAEYEPDDYYETLLNVADNGIMGYVEIPKIDVTEPIYHYSHEVSLGKGVGHIHGSSLPVGGKSTHSVLTGHRGLPTQKFFSDLDKIGVGDKFYLHVLNEIMAYRVYNITTIEPSDVDALFIEDSRDLVTLVTCTPYGVNTHRLLVMGERISNDEVKVDSEGNVVIENHEFIIDPAVWVFIGFIVFIFIVFFVTLIKNIKYKIAKKKSSKEKAEGDSG